jgi:hypothetical protein
MNGSPYHKLAKWLVDILKPIRSELAVHSLKDTFDFLHALDQTDIADTVMCSFDVQSLFTNVPLEETVDFLYEYIMDHPSCSPLPAPVIKDLILLCTKNIKFYFQDTGYRQFDGVAMGSPLGPTLADLFMAKLEREAAHHINRLKLYKRYLDDIFILSPGRLQIDEMFSFLNSIHPNISFTCEFENDNAIAFLDIMISRQPDGTMSRSIYRKPTWTGQYQNFFSFIPEEYKR